MTFKAIQPFFAAVFVCAAFLAATPSPAPAAGACETLRAEFTKKLRPRILRLAKKQFHWSNWYHATLKRQQGSDRHPSPEAMETTYTLMLDYCGGNAKCKAFAGDMNTASRSIYDVNRRWSAAGCPGQLDN